MRRGMRGGLADEAPHVCHRAMHTITRTRTSPPVGPLRGGVLYPNPLIRSKHVLSLGLNRQEIPVNGSLMLSRSSPQCLTKLISKDSYGFKDSIIFRDCTAQDLFDGYVQIDQDNRVTHTARYGFFRYWRFCERGGITWIPIALTNNARKFGPELSCVKRADHGSGEEVARYSCPRRESRDNRPTGTGHSRSPGRHRESARFHPNMMIGVHQNERDWERYHDRTVYASLGHVHGR
jgi:hypothetical protein